MSDHRRICIRCEESKPLTLGNYKRREAYLDLKPPYDRMCRVCRDANDEKNRMARKKSMKKRCVETICSNPECKKIFIPRRFDTKTCSRICSDRWREIRKEEEVEELAKDEKKPINKKFLVRGKIHNEGYTWM